MTGWQKYGCLYCCQQLHPKLHTHTANPVALKLENSIYRIFFSARDLENRSSVGAVDIDIESQNVVQEHTKPFFEFGGKHSFYSHGVSIGNIYQIGEQKYMLFMGWEYTKAWSLVWSNWQITIK